MFLALFLVCNPEGVCVAVKAPQMDVTHEECVKELAFGTEEIVRQGVIVKDLMCVQFSVEE